MSNILHLVDEIKEYILPPAVSCTSVWNTLFCWSSCTWLLTCRKNFVFFCPEDAGRDTTVGIATRYGLDGPGIECRWGRDFPHPSRPSLGSTQPPIQMGTGSLSPGVKRPGRGVDHPPHLAPKFKERVELYFYSTSGPSWPPLE